ncbi:MAG: chemotaxis protein CheW [Verrucomicrobiales bacterium]|nr:chemotaxis protein CheW [Verrucomicrobiales bacterium]
MTFLLFQLGDDRYVISAIRILEVLPLVTLKRFPQAPNGVAGAFNYHGTEVPVIDLQAMATNVPAARRLSTRIILVHYPVDAKKQYALGLLVEHTTETIKKDVSEFLEPTVIAPHAPYLGRVCKDDRGLIQWIDVENLLTPQVRNALFASYALV